MSLYKTKPRWHRGEIVATERGWVNPQNNEVLVSIGNLKSKLEAEDRAINIPVEVENVEVENVEAENVEAEVKITRKYTKKSTVESKKENIMEDPKKEIIAEVVESITDSKKIIGEVVESDLKKQIIAE